MDGVELAAIHPVSNRYGLFVVITPACRDRIRHAHAKLRVDYVGNVHVLLAKDHKVPLLDWDHRYRCLCIAVDELGNIVTRA
jgi:hypothetical protein